MGNSVCPVCGERTVGKAIRQVNFCRSHRDLAVYLRDQEEVKSHEQRIGKTLWGPDFTEFITSFIRDANNLLQQDDMRIIGT